MEIPMENPDNNQEDLFRQYTERFYRKPYPFRQIKNQAQYFDTSEWIKVKLKKEMIQPNLLAFMIAVNEIFRFEIGASQPEVCLSDTHRLARRVQQDDSVDKYQVRTLYYYWKNMIAGDCTIWEGMGRVVFNKFLYQENDFNLYNAVVDKHDYFVGLDHNASFWPIVAKYHQGKKSKPDNIKVLVHNNSPFKTISALNAVNEPIYLIREKKRDFIGTLNGDDYESLPRLKHQYPTQWYFHSPELKDYCDRISHNQRFSDEKHFSAFKAIITIDIKRWILGLHIRHINDRQDANRYVTSQITTLTEICLNSPGFIHYLKTWRTATVLAVIYEISVFFNQQAIYRLDDAAFQNRFQIGVYQTVLCRCMHLFNQLQIPLSQAEQSQLIKQFTLLNDFQGQPMESVLHFYQAQSMNYQADKLQELLKREAESSIQTESPPGIPAAVA